MLAVTFLMPTGALGELFRCLAMVLVYAAVFVAVAVAGAVLWSLVCKLALPVMLIAGFAYVTYPKVVAA